ncbi:MAG: tRNA epoxyqueuosine(34) reductase QueG [Saprospiraceae bacterium]|nr:tRNA epoxyqueuosine(34) reductase QueG [Candidatus Vicinibacter affinis]MBK7797926.1 tRNA epoxyqueuosine(34) reductase QueG [Candidatus Vicinibacter affinis]MBK9642443.1 tRNA epoxyqueuosine(34) reductase QueG [Candidatus Vicinibacter affinis]MBP6522280.1 tRNA epoxyqueuosine(34) reductase QueG [Saprospiraceae bacterium]
MKVSNSLIYEKVTQLGFDQIGIVKAQKLDKEAKQLEEWLNKNYNGEMHYMERYFDLRTDPTLLLPGCKSIIVLSLNYDQPKVKFKPNSPKISKYAVGKDYHKVIKDKSKQLIAYMRNLYGDIQIRGFVDSGPVMERSWAEKAGIGWNGKNTLNIHPKRGSYYFLCCILTDLEFEYTQSIKDHCGTCKRCIEACPTSAIHQDGYLLDAAKCISYLTIELKTKIPEEFRPKMETWAFGCDICQEVCPWNRFSKPTRVEEFAPNPDLINLSMSDWLEISDETWNKVSVDSPIKRAGKENFQRNIRFIV